MTFTNKEFLELKQIYKEEFPTLKMLNEAVGFREPKPYEMYLTLNLEEEFKNFGGTEIGKRLIFRPVVTGSVEYKITVAHVYDKKFIIIPDGYSYKDFKPLTSGDYFIDDYLGVVKCNFPQSKMPRIILNKNE